MDNEKMYIFKNVLWIVDPAITDIDQYLTPEVHIVRYVNEDDYLLL